MFDWNDLRFFIAVARTQSLSGAAAKLGINHSTVGRRIHALEDSMAVQLFDKLPAGYALTDAGSKLLEIAEQIETSCMSAQELVAGQDPLLTGSVRLSVPEGFGTHFLIKHLSDFFREYPGIDLEIMALPHFLSISKREADLAITPVRPVSGRLITRVLTDFTNRVYGSAGYLKNSPAINGLSDLMHHNLITSFDDFTYGLDEVLPEAHVRLRIKSINGQLTAVESGLGLGMIPCFMGACREKLVEVLPDEAKTVRTLWLTMHEDMRTVRRVTAVWDWVKNITASHQALLLGTSE